MNLMSVRRPRNKIEPKNEGLNESSFEQNVDQSVIEEDSQVIKLGGLNNNKDFLQIPNSPPPPAHV
jgi:hypothetical protein